MNGCIYRTKDGECDLYSEGGKYHAFCVGDEPCDGRKPSNADKLRSMRDEELAVFMAANQGVTAFDGSGNEYRRWLDWLRQEAET